MTSDSSTTTDIINSYTMTEFIALGEASDAVDYTKLSFIETYNSRDYTICNVLTDYLYELKNDAITVTLSNAEQLKYRYRPKILSYDVYGTTELYYIILLLNGICNVKEFDFTSLKMLKKDDMSNFLSEIYTANKSDISKYNTIHQTT